MKMDEQVGDFLVAFRSVYLDVLNVKDQSIDSSSKLSLCGRGGKDQLLANSGSSLNLTMHRNFKHDLKESLNNETFMSRSLFSDPFANTRSLGVFVQMPTFLTLLPCVLVHSF